MHFSQCCSSQLGVALLSLLRAFFPELLVCSESERSDSAKLEGLRKARRSPSWPYGSSSPSLELHPSLQDCSSRASWEADRESDEGRGQFRGAETRFAARLEASSCRSCGLFDPNQQNQTKAFADMPSPYGK